MNEEYSDIIDLPYTKSDRHPHMSIRDRAAQFAPFSALTGYSDTVNEAGRRTESEKKLDDYQISEINMGLQYIFENLKSIPKISVTYFIPDKSKHGGKYVTLNDYVQAIDDYEKMIELSCGEIIRFEQIISLSIKNT